MLAFAVLIAETIVLGKLPPPEPIILLSLLVPIFSEMGSFALNDYLDIETDRLNKEFDRPLVSGVIQPAFALWFSVMALIVSTIIAFFINQSAFLIVLIFNILAIAYNWKLKDLPLVGNIYIGLSMAIPFIFGNFVVSQSLSPLALILALLAFVAGLAREIIKSAQDMEGDKAARGSKTLPILIGKKNAVLVAVLLYLFFIPLSALPFSSGLRVSLLPLVLITAADLLILAIVFKLITAPDASFRFARKMSLFAFLIGLSGLLVAAVL